MLLNIAKCPVCGNKHDSLKAEPLEAIKQGPSPFFCTCPMLDIFFNVTVNISAPLAIVGADD